MPLNMRRFRPHLCVDNTYAHINEGAFDLAFSSNLMSAGCVLKTNWIEAGQVPFKTELMRFWQWRVDLIRQTAWD